MARTRTHTCIGHPGLSYYSRSGRLSQTDFPYPAFSLQCGASSAGGKVQVSCVAEGGQVTNVTCIYDGGALVESCMYYLIMKYRIQYTVQRHDILLLACPLSFSLSLSLFLLSPPSLLLLHTFLCLPLPPLSPHSHISLCLSHCPSSLSLVTCLAGNLNTSIDLERFAAGAHILNIIAYTADGRSAQFTIGFQVAPGRSNVQFYSSIARGK